MHHHLNEDENGDVTSVVEFCSDSCNRDYCGVGYSGWDGCHEPEFTTYCANCGVAIPGEDACEHQSSNVLVNRFLSDTGEQCEHGNWIQLPASHIAILEVR